MSESLFGPTKVATAVEIPARTLIQLSESRIIQAAIEAQGRGSGRRYSNFNVFQLLLYRILRSEGLERRPIKRRLEQHELRLWRLMREKGGEKYEITDGPVGIIIDLPNLRNEFARVMGALEDGAPVAAQTATKPAPEEE